MRPSGLAGVGVPCALPAGQPLSGRESATKSVGHPAAGIVARHRPLAPLRFKSGCTGVSKPRVPMATMISVLAPTSRISRPVVSWRCAVKPLVRHGPVQFSPPS